MEKDIKKKAEEYKKRNGNSNITNKELLFYIVARLDDIEKINNEQDKEIQCNKTMIRVFWLLLPCAIGITALVTSLI